MHAASLPFFTPLVKDYLARYDRTPVREFFEYPPTATHETWRVAIDAGVHHPIIGVGASGFRTEWLKHRHIDENVRDAHSLELETFGELGLVGIALLGTLLGAVALSAGAAHRADPALAAGPAAVLALWAFHSAIDWDWEMPALTLAAVVLAGMLVSRSQPA